VTAGAGTIQRIEVGAATNALVTKIICSEKEGVVRAKAVRVGMLEGSEVQTITAKREIVLCSGALSNPQILMLSGIGPRSHLEECGIKVIKDLPGVGNHLQDHFSVSLGYFIPMSDSLVRITSAFTFLKEMVRYLITGNGLILNPVPEIIMFGNSKLLDETTGKFGGTPIQRDAWNADNLPDFEIQPIAWDATGRDFDKTKGAFSFLATLARPKSVGTLRLQSTDPRDEPLIDLNFFSSEEDRIVMRKTIRTVLNLVNGLRKGGYHIEDYPGRVPASARDEDLDAHAREFGRTIFHYSSSCRMGTATDSVPAVVDDQLKVYGIEGLRIADASVFPTSPAAHLQAPAVVVAEKCAEMMNAARRK